MTMPAPMAAMLSPPVLEVEGLTRDFAIGLGRWRVRAVDNLHLTVRAGEVVGLLGPNGSGKSTTLKAILGLVEPTAGTVRLWGQPASEPANRARLGYLPEEPTFPRHLTARELVTWHARLAGRLQAGLATRVAAVLAEVGLADAADRRLGTYSKGMVQRAALAQALVHEPELLILDEPTSGLDPMAAAAWAAMIRGWQAQGRTVLLCSHLLAEVEQVCDRVVILHRGRTVAAGTLPELLTEPETWQATVRGWDEGRRAELAAWLAERGASLEGVEPGRRRLEALFRAAVEADQTRPEERS